MRKLTKPEIAGLIPVCVGAVVVSGSLVLTALASQNGTLYEAWAGFWDHRPQILVVFILSWILVGTGWIAISRRLSIRMRLSATKTMVNREIASLEAQFHGAGPTPVSTAKITPSLY